MKHVSHLLDEYLAQLRNQDRPSDERRVEHLLYGERDRVEVRGRETWDPFPDELPTREDA